MLARARSVRGLNGRAGGVEDTKLSGMIDAYFATLNHFEARTAAHYASSPRGFVVSLPNLFTSLSRGNAYEMFLTILRTYQHPPKTRAALEKAAAFFAKKATIINRKILSSGTPEEMKAFYDKTIASYRAMGELARASIESGRPCGDGDVCSAGCFRIVNAGGYDAAHVEVVRDLTEQAAHYLRAKGFEKVCYGDVQVVRRVHRANVAALYTPREDQIYVRGDLPEGRSSVLQVVLHELGHRLVMRFLSQAQRERMRTIFRRYTDARERGAWTGPAPEIGMEITIKGEAFEVIGVERFAARGVPKVRLKMKGDEAARFTIPLDGWYAHHGGRREGDRFVTRYASTDPDENFAEMFSYYVLGTLSPEAAADFRWILDG